MGFPRPLFRAAVATVATSALIASGLALAAPASADPASPTPVSGTALPTAQVNGVVWTQAVSNGIDYVGGSFSQSQPAGAAAGVGVTARSNLFAYDVTTGTALAGFNAVTNAQVRGIAASPDGSRIYIVGDFTTVNGQARDRIAALDRSGNLVADFAPSLNGPAIAISATSTRVFVGGAFTAASGQTRSKAAAFSTSGALLPWAPQVAGGTVRAIAVAPDASKVLVAGSFTSTNGSTTPGRGMAAVDPSTGTSLPWATSSIIHNGGVVNDPAAPATASSSIYSLSTRGDVVYATGQATGTAWTDANLEGMVAMRWSDGGGMLWLEDCHGDTYSSVAFDDAVYVASHSHNCSTLGGFGEMSPDAHRAIGFSQAATQTLGHNTVQGPGSYQDFAGYPAPSLLDWYPTLSVGTYTGASQAAWSVAQGSGYLVYGGEFPKVNGVRQTGLVRFQGYDDPANGVTEPTPTPTPTPTETTTPTPTPTGSSSSSDRKPNRLSTPSAVALGPSAVAVKWSAPKAAMSDNVSGYVVKAYKGSKVVKTMNVGKSKRVATISGLKKSTTYRIAVAAKNSHGAGKLSPQRSVRTKAKGKNVSATKRPAKVQRPGLSKGSGRLRVKWAAASTSGALGVSSYQVRFVLHGKTVKTVTMSSSARSKLVTGLKKRTTYSVSVRASNWAGWGSWSTARSGRTK